MKHELKIMSNRFIDICTRKKKFEIRKNDRNYHVGHTLILREVKEEQFTGRWIATDVIYIDDYAQKDDYVVLGLGDFFGIM